MKIRKSNFELMRIVSMFFIVLFHIIGHGNLLDENRYGNQTIFVFFKFIYLIIIVHVNSFVLLSGYFQSNKEFKLNKLLSIVNSTIFYRVIILIVFCVLGYLNITAVNILRSIFPIPVTEYWFMQCYLLLYMLSPFINKLIEKMDKKLYLKLLFLLFFILCIIPIISNQQILKNDGFTIHNFVFLYLIGGYLRKYPVKENAIFSNFSKRAYQITLFLIIFFCVFLNFSLNYTTNYLQNISPFFSELFQGICNSQYFYNNPVTIIQVISYFLLFESFDFKSTIANKISKYVFGIYLIHDHREVREYIYVWLSIKTDKIINSYKFIIYIFICAIIIFVTCFVIEFVRQMIFKFISSRKISKKISNKFYKSVEEININV